MGDPLSLTLAPGEYYLCRTGDTPIAIGSYQEGPSGCGIQFAASSEPFPEYPGDFQVNDFRWSQYLVYNEPWLNNGAQDRNKLLEPDRRD